MDRTNSKIDTSLARGNRVSFSRPVRYELIDRDGRSAGTFINAKAAAEHARYRWPDQEQDEDRAGKGWDVQVVGAE